MPNAGMDKHTTSKKEMRKVVIASLLGATIEWYDFFLYGVVADIVFNKLYFPTADPFMGTILAYSTFAIGYLARPLGGFIFGHYGDKLGRKRMLILTMLIMGIATVGIGLVPTYASIGIAAVSYTHLDVYKRQGWHMHIAGLAVGVGGRPHGPVLVSYVLLEKMQGLAHGFFAHKPVGMAGRQQSHACPGIGRISAVNIAEQVDSTAADGKRTHAGREHTHLFSPAGGGKGSHKTGHAGTHHKNVSNPAHVRLLSLIHI